MLLGVYKLGTELSRLWQGVGEGAVTTASSVLVFPSERAPSQILSLSPLDQQPQHYLGTAGIRPWGRACLSLLNCPTGGSPVQSELLLKAQEHWSAGRQG